MHKTPFLIKTCALLGFLFKRKPIDVLSPKFENITKYSKIQQRWKALHCCIYFGYGPGKHIFNLAPTCWQWQSLLNRTWEIQEIKSWIKVRNRIFRLNLVCPETKKQKQLLQSLQRNLWWLQRRIFKFI